MYFLFFSIFGPCSVNKVCTYYQKSSDKYNWPLIKLSCFLLALSHYTMHRPVFSSYMKETKRN